MSQPLIPEDLTDKVGFYPGLDGDKPETMEARTEPGWVMEIMGYKTHSLCAAIVDLPSVLATANVIPCFCSRCSGEEALSA